MLAFSNASSLPPRLPVLSRILEALSVTSDGEDRIEFKFVALSYRGYWTSSGRPSQKGIRMDVAATLDWIIKTSVEKGIETDIVLWGQSIGAGVAAIGAADLVESGKMSTARRLRIGGLILETPFTSMKDMLIAIYPQKWLPYRYLWPFLRSTWDTQVALKTIAKARHNLKILILEAGNDELVPAEQGAQLVQLCHQLAFRLSRRIVQGAYHTEVLSRTVGQKAVSQFVHSVYSATTLSDAPKQEPFA